MAALCLSTSHAAAQLSAPADQVPVKTVVVVGKKRGMTIDQTPPRLRLMPADIQAYGADSVEDLLTLLKPQTRGAEGKPPVVLLNGHRVSGFSILKDIPPEAIARIDTFPEGTAQAYGYPPGQMVMNIVLVADYRGRTAEAAQTGGVGDPGARSSFKYSHLHIGETRRINLSLNYETARHALESQRDVVTQVNQTNLASWRTAVPDSDHIEANASVSGTLFDTVEATLEGSIKGGRRDGQLGLASGRLMIPASNPFSSAGETVQIDRYFPEAGALRQAESEWNSHGGVSLNGALKTWQWTLIANADHMVSHTRAETGLDLATVQSLIDLGNVGFDPFKPLSTFARTASDQRSVSDQYMLMGMASGSLIRLPAGPLMLSVNLGRNGTHISTATDGSGTRQTEGLDQSGLTSRITAFLPVSQQGKSLLPGMGEFRLNAGLNADSASGFKNTTGFTYGFQWVPFRALSLTASRWHSKMAPPALSLTSDTIEIPNSLVFDYVRGEDVLVTQVLGGNASLPASRTDTTNIDLFITPFPKIDLSFSSGLSLSTTTDGLGMLPPPTREAELAFPDRYTRDAEGRLVRIDARTITYARQQSDQLRTDLTYNCTWTACAWLKVFYLPDSRLSVSLNHTQRLKDAVLIRAGMPEIDRLKGGITAPGAPQPAAQLEWNIGLTAPVGGVWFSGRWQGGAHVVGGRAESNLSASAATLADLRVFVNLDHLRQTASTPWAQNLRVTVSVDNLLDDYPSVTDETGHTPALYQRGLIDPMGRTASLTLRKSF